MRLLITYRFYLVLAILLCSNSLLAQDIPPVMGPPPQQVIPPIPSFEERQKKWGPNDTILVSAIWYGTSLDSFEMLSYREEENVWVTKMSDRQLQRKIAEWTRLRNAVYVTYPYARTAGYTINEMNARLATISSKKERKAYIKSREKELKKKFADPLSNLSVYQGRVLMKLINRQTGNNCYEIIKEFKGGLNATMYQTVAFFFGGNLKQKYDVAGDSFDRQIESYVKEIDGNWYNNAFRKGN